MSWRTGGRRLVVATLGQARRWEHRHVSLVDAQVRGAVGAGARRLSDKPGGAEWEVIGSKKGPQWTVGDEQSTSKKCDPYEQGGKPLEGKEIERIRSQVPEWHLSDKGTSISRSWRAQDFNEACDFLKRIAILSQNEAHQPRSVQLELVRGKEEVTVVCSTPRLKGLSYADFMLALKIDMMASTWT